MQSPAGPGTRTESGYDLVPRYSPDMEVDALPGNLQKGKGAQPDATMKYLMDKIKAHPLTLPRVPD